jgi:hypothetical protein
MMSSRVASSEHINPQCISSYGIGVLHLLWLVKNALLNKDAGNVGLISIAP